MKNAKTTLICLTALLLASTVLMVITVEAQNEYMNMQESGSIPLPSGVTPDVTVDTHAGLSFRPNPIGVNQIFLVNIWIIPSTAVSQYLTGFKVTIVKPNNETKIITMNSYYGDATAWFEYIADQPGIWKLKFEFPGGYFPAGNYSVPPESYAGFAMGLKVQSFTKSVYYKPVSTEWRELKVVEGYTAQSWPQTPLPTDYWTRPANPVNREWWPILGNYPWHGPAKGGPGGEALWNQYYPNTNKYWSSLYRFIPWVQAPNTAHIVWKRQDAIGGIIGGDLGQDSLPLQISGTWNFPSIIYGGRCYQIVASYGGNVKIYAAKGGVWNWYPTGLWRCYDLRTGEVYWERPISVTAFGPPEQQIVSMPEPTAIEYYVPSGEVPGAEAWTGTGTLISLIHIGNGRLIKYDPFTGIMLGNYSIAPLTSGTYYRNGYALSVQALGAGNYRLINWTTFGGTASIKDRIITNKTWPWSSLPSTIDFNAGIAVSMSAITPPGTEVQVESVIRAASLKTGEEIWNITFNGISMFGTECADHGKFAFVARGVCRAYAFNLNDGSLAWESDPLDYPWGQWLSYSGCGSAYGLLYELGYDGVYAFNWNNGKLVWKYEAPALSPYETPYTGRNGTTVYSFWGPLLIADGKVYACNGEHSPSQPLTRGWGLHCINATTGKLIWKIMGVFTPGAVADGYLAAGSIQDGYMYVFGKGKSSTSISVSQDMVAKGSTVLIKGSVLDMSPAQPGTPCVSKESMETWMEYLHMQMPIDGLWHNETITGVPVTLTAIAEDNSYFNIGTVVTDGYSGTFGVAWTPPKEGKYKIIASFAGDDSYGSSSATTWITVGPPPKEIEIPEYPTPTDYTPILTALAIAIIVVAILVVYDIITVRKLRK
jgi:hypothetical protein